MLSTRLVSLWFRRVWNRRMNCSAIRSSARSFARPLVRSLARSLTPLRTAYLADMPHCSYSYASSLICLLRSCVPCRSVMLKMVHESNASISFYFCAMCNVQCAQWVKTDRSNSWTKNLIPMSSRMSEIAGKQTNERSGAREQSDRCEQMSKRMARYSTCRFHTLSTQCALILVWFFFLTHLYLAFCSKSTLTAPKAKRRFFFRLLFSFVFSIAFFPLFIFRCVHAFL